MGYKKRDFIKEKNQKWIRQDTNRMSRMQLEDEARMLGICDERLKAMTSDEIRRYITKRMTVEYSNFERKTGFR